MNKLWAVRFDRDCTDERKIRGGYNRCEIGQEYFSSDAIRF